MVIFSLGLPQERNKCEQELKLFKNSRVGGPGWGSIIENILKKKNRIVYGLGVDTVKLKKKIGVGRVESVGCEPTIDAIVKVGVWGVGRGVG